MFYAVAVLVTLAALLPVLLPLLTGAARAERRASHDKQVLRDQLREIDRDEARGLLTADEAAAGRVELSRRLLAADDAEAGEAASRAAPRRLSLAMAFALVVGLGLAAGGLYLAVGEPGLGDQPLAARQAQWAAARAERPTQDEVEALLAGRDAGAAEPAEPPTQDLALVERMRDLLADRPDDLRGHQLLARALASLGRWKEARQAQARVVELLGGEAGAADHVALAEFMILATEGYVSPEAERALARGLELDPSNPVARYYSGLNLWQGGRPDLAYELWARLRDEGPADAPWMAAIDAQIDALARDAGRTPPADARGPGPADVEAAQEMPEAERLAMIEGMVSGLAGRLAAEGGPVEDWARLIRSLGVLGDRQRAEAIWEEARGAFAGDPAALETLRVAARDAGLAE